MVPRVVVTGMGVISPIGQSVETFWDSLTSGRSGIRTIDSFDASPYKVRIAGAVRDFDPETVIDRREARRMDRYCQLAVAAARQAVKDAGLDISERNARRVGVYIGTGVGGLQTMLDNYKTLLERGPGRVSPAVVPMMIANMAAAQVSIMTGAKGPTLAPVTACATGNTAIGEAFKLIQRGGADTVIAGGTESTTHGLALAGFGNASAASTRNDAPEKASRPFDAGRDGFVMAEGSGVLVLEALDHALARGARIYAEIVGYASTSDAYHMVAPDPEGLSASAAMTLALEDAGLPPEAVDHINAHATGTQLGDLAETVAVKTAFGKHAYRIPITANKSMLGHMLGAAGGVEAIALIQTIRHGLIPPTINLDHPDPDCDLDYVPHTARRAEVDVGLSNSVGFGGHNAMLVLRGYR
ncbi:beta-ketoacyl-ACP synthase II [Paenibacillus puerhi]|uniref:beta-ketoacyl-ACP synthase II n=1 Tax=Paenibacillus puerhi TaxID=2692622 RepID=UPI001359DC64|nr:beta-ketoacyl-ACP synthase II [Paenibacillus puerhi]